MSGRYTSVSRCQPKNKNIDGVAGRPPMDYAQDVHGVKKDLKGKNQTCNISHQIITC